MTKYNHFYLLRKDPLGEFNLVLGKIIRWAYIGFSTTFMRLYISMGGAKLGKNVKFRGFTLIDRFPCSSIKIGDGCTFNSSSLFNYRGLNHRCIIQTGRPGAKIAIGRHCGFSGCSIVANLDVTFGDYCTVGANAIIGDRDDHEDIYPTAPDAVHIGSHVWVGMNATILKGVTIGDNAIIGAGAIVTKDVPANAIVAGIPARVIKFRT